MSAGVCQQDSKASATWRACSDRSLYSAIMHHDRRALGLLHPQSQAHSRPDSAIEPDDDTLTTRCLLQYCAQWPHHRSWVHSVLSNNGFSLEYLEGTHFAADKELVLAAVTHCGAALQFACEDLKADMDVVLAAVKNDPFSLGFACEGLRGDSAVVLAALRRDPAALAMADPRLFHSAEFMLAAIALDATAVTYAAPELLSDPAFRAAAKVANSFVGHFWVKTPHFPALTDPAVQAEFQVEQ